MTLHYHGTPITPLSVLAEMRGRNLCVSFERPEQIKVADAIAQSVMLDNGAFSIWRRGAVADWPGYYAWCERWLDRPTTWAVIPDVIVGDECEQDSLIAAWPFGTRGAPVWHMHDSLERVRRLTDAWPVVCIGSSAQYADLLTNAWCRRIDAAWTEIMRGRNRAPWVHMLRGMQLVGQRWPFASVDSTDIARNHNRQGNCAGAMAERWDARQCPREFVPMAEQLELA